MKNLFYLSTVVAIFLIGGFIEAPATEFNHKWYYVSIDGNSKWPDDPEYLDVKYMSSDIRVDEKTTVISFDCEVTGNDKLTPSLNWYYGNSEFPFTSEPVTVDVYVDRKFIYTLTGVSLGVHEGTININKNEFKNLIGTMATGNILEVFIYNQERKIEEHVLVSINQFSPINPVLRCFEFL